MPVFSDHSLINPDSVCAPVVPAVSKRFNRIVLTAVFSLFSLSATVYGSARLTTIAFKATSGRLIIDVRFDNTVTYTVRAENNGTSLILRAPSATVTKTVTDRVTVPPNTILSGWSLRESDGVLQAEFRLTGPYSYSHTYREPATVQIEIFGARQPETINPSPAAATTAAPPAGSSGSGLERGIRLYQDGRYDDALNEFKDVLATSNRCPLLYYYAAQIRIKKNQFNRAEENLLAALRDSATFADARGLLAYTRLKLGNPNDALADWRLFVASVGTPDEKQPVTVDSILQPEEYRSRLRRSEENARRVAALEKAREDSISAARAVKQLPTATTPADTASEAPAQGGEDVVEAPGVLEDRIRSNIRVGLYGLSAFAFVIALFIGGTVLYIRKRKRSRADLTFTTEIQRILDQRTEDEELLEDEEDHAAREYRTISSAMENIDQTAVEPVAPESIKPEQTPAISFDRDIPEPTEYSRPYESRSETITEEVKGLVTRMFKEGRSIPEIARAADLTQTEIELIVAVRARRMEKLIEDVASEEEDDFDRDHLYQAISELKYEGGTNRDIARKLGISTSEVQLAISLMAMRKKHRG